LTIILPLDQAVRFIVWLRIMRDAELDASGSGSLKHAEFEARSSCSIDTCLGSGQLREIDRDRSVILLISLECAGIYRSIRVDMGGRETSIQIIFILNDYSLSVTSASFRH